MITAKVVADSVSPEGKRITSLQLHYPKFIHGEFMTHRVFSRNASSSRAIPFEKFTDDVFADIAMPVHWGRNQPGMQAREEIDENHKEIAKQQWGLALNSAYNVARYLHNVLGVHKQVVNRLLEPFYNINVLCTATEWDNFFELRLHPDAQPEMHELARVMKEAMDESTPVKLEYRQWHLPYVDINDLQQSFSLVPHSPYEAAIRMSVARCARVSYLTQAGKTPSIEEDLKLYDRLVGSKPIHASPAEHQATPDRFHYQVKYDRTDQWHEEPLHGNFVGWKQYRKILEKGVSVE